MSSNISMSSSTPVFNAKHERYEGENDTFRLKRHHTVAHDDIELAPLSTEDELLLQSLPAALVSNITTIEIQRQVDALNHVKEHREMKLRTSRLPALLKAIRSIMISTKNRTVVSFSTLMSQVEYTMLNNIPKAHLEESVRAIARLVPEWCKI